MPHLPDHETHDPELVAAYAAGDATGPALDTAAALVATCPECAELHRDLRAIAAALPAMPAPVRPRDFRLTAETAASLRPTGWRGFMAVLAGPRFSLAAPLGAGLAALGLAGLLLGSGGLPLAGSAASATATAAAAAAAGNASGDGLGPRVDARSTGGAPVTGAAAADPGASERPVALVPESASTQPPAPAAGLSSAASPAASAGPSGGDRFQVEGAPIGSPVPAASARDDTAMAIETQRTPLTGDTVTKGGDQPVAPAGQDGTAPVLAAIVLFVLGLAIIGLRVAARRVA